MTTPTRTRRLAAAAVALSLCAPAPGAAQSGGEPDRGKLEEARARFNKAEQLYRQGAYDACLSELERAYSLAPSYRLLYNIGLAHRQLNNFVAAVASFESYLAEGGADVPAGRRSELERDLVRLRAQTAAITVAVNVPGARVSVDDVVVGESPLSKPLVVNAGRRRIGAQREGKLPAVRVLTVAGGDAVDVSLELGDVTAAAPSPAAPAAPAPAMVVVQAPAPAAPPPKPVPWLGWALTGTLTAGAIVTGLFAFSARGDLDDERKSPRATRASLDDAQARARSLTIASDALGGAALVSGGLTLYFTFRPDSPPPRAGAADSLFVGYAGTF
jgi:hypothetical protein